MPNFAADLVTDMVRSQAKRQAQRDAEFADFRVRADEACQLSGVSVPRIGPGEDLNLYRRRVFTALQPHSPTWKNADFMHPYSTPDSILPMAEKQLIADAVAEFKKPVGELRSILTVDPESGQRKRIFYGDPENVWAPFKGPVKRVTSWTNEVGRGRNTPDAVVPVKTLMSDGTTRSAR